VRPLGPPAAGATERGRGSASRRLQQLGVQQLGLQQQQLGLQQQQLGGSSMPQASRMLSSLLLTYGAATAAAVAGVVVVDVSRMWRELDAHCAQGLCLLAEGSVPHLAPGSITNTTDCRGRLLAYEYGLKLLPARQPQLESFDALQLESTCGVTRPPAAPLVAPPLGNTKNGDDSPAAALLQFVVRPGQSIAAVLARTRAAGPQFTKRIVLKKGVHYLNATLELGPSDSGLTITAEPGALPGSVVVSGGVLLQPTWKKSARQNPPGGLSGSDPAPIIWETAIPPSLAEDGAFRGLTTLNPHRRVTRARFPNAGAAQGAELCTHGCWASGIKEWHKNTSCVGQATVVYKDLRDCDNDMRLADGSPCKNDSAMFDSYHLRVISMATRIMI
jgi:hypothetical protein